MAVPDLAAANAPMPRGLFKPARSVYAEKLAKAGITGVWAAKAVDQQMEEHGDRVVECPEIKSVANKLMVAEKVRKKGSVYSTKRRVLWDTFFFITRRRTMHDFRLYEESEMEFFLDICGFTKSERSSMMEYSKWKTRRETAR